MPKVSTFPSKKQKPLVASQLQCPVLIPIYPEYKENTIRIFMKNQFEEHIEFKLQVIFPLGGLASNYYKSMPEACHIIAWYVSAL
ncbi:MAG: hypothetical protein DWQ02_23905 [Bacteroidetes bacterium]|nr:MAG: hypothetical protein DWQ02_23905 [Bacteroidota bacterium]